MNFASYTLLVPIDLRVCVERLFREKCMQKIILPMIRQKRIETIRRLRHKYTRIDASHQLDDYFYWRSGFNFISQKCIEDQRTKNSSIPIFIDNELQYLSVEENEMFYNYLVFVKYNDVVNQCPMTIINRS